ncbi:MAG: nuclear transport factor 2 family protein [Gammaproteobacteria bacterium]|nr:nuclear transport factor 2 family protein [Gammaproteobacteria bacterium]
MSGSANEVLEQALDDYARLYESITPADLEKLDRYFASDARFKDPFNDVRGLDAIRHVFERMFETCLDLQFNVQHRFLEEATGCLIWSFRFRPNVAGLRRQTWSLEGSSRIRFDAAGKIVEHVDFWDSGEYFYARLPVIGAIIRFIRRRAG